ncbi:MAG: prepilin-type N-terminal cleavage/methylation domain-containing protein [Fimbriimonadaceae bacterium]
MHTNKSRFRTGFTLIELLVVIAIIAILASILFPVFARAKESAKKTVDLAHIKQVGLANIIYLSDFDNAYIPFPYADRWSTPSYQAGQKGPYWTDRLMPYMKNDAIFQSSSNTDTAFYPRGYWQPGSTTPTGARKYRVTYAINHLISHADFHPDFPGSAAESNINDIGATALIGPQQQAFTFSTCQPDSPGSQTMSYFWNISDPTAGYGFELFGNKGLQGGFFGGANFSFTDGHAKFARTVNAGTAPGDQYSYHGRDLFLGYFAGVKTRAEVSNDATCPSDRRQAAF